MTTDLRDVAEWDWLIGDRATVLHHPASGQWDHETATNVTYTRGRVASFARIPSLSARLGMKRCDRCCDRLGYPRGVGSPKNDDTCRPLVAARLGMEEHDLGGERLIVHGQASCEPPCPVHAPSDHPLAEARLHWRSDRGLWERICVHGTGHPDPDEYASHAYETHGCCAAGCCGGAA